MSLHIALHLDFKSFQWKPLARVHRQGASTVLVVIQWGWAGLTFNKTSSAVKFVLKS